MHGEPCKRRFVYDYARAGEKSARLRFRVPPLRLNVTCSSNALKSSPCTFLFFSALDALFGHGPGMLLWGGSKVSEWKWPRNAASKDPKPTAWPLQRFQALRLGPTMVPLWHAPVWASLPVVNPGAPAWNAPNEVVGGSSQDGLGATEAVFAGSASLPKPKPATKPKLLC